MAEHSAIEWTDHTLNFWIGCQEVSPACDHCYAKTQNEHRKWVAGWGPDGERRRTAASTWQQLRTWNKRAKARGVREKVFSNSLSDFFDNRTPSVWRREAWHYIEQCDGLDFLLLTERPQNIVKMLPDPESGTKPWGEGWPNVWLGTTAENQTEADRRIPHLLATPAAKRFLSCEPLLGHVNLDGWLSQNNSCQSCDDGEGYGNRCSRDDIPRDERCPWRWAVQQVTEHGPFDKDECPAAITSQVVTLDWIIAGGESGPRARPMHPDWARSLRDQCQAAGVPFFFKQWGEWAPGEAFGMCEDRPVTTRHGAVRDWMHRYVVCADRADRLRGHSFTQHAVDLVYRVGKSRAGALLDGREWREMPR